MVSHIASTELQHVDWPIKFLRVVDWGRGGGMAQVAPCLRPWPCTKKKNIVKCVDDIGVGAQSTLGGHVDIVARKICVKN